MSNPSSGDSDELEALFDSIVMGSMAPAEEAPAAKENSAEIQKPSSTPAGDGIHEPYYSQIGHLTRKLHDSLRELGFDKTLEKAVHSSIPDARDRLAYIATLTEQAAERALNATEAAKPYQEQLESGANDLAGQWDRLFNNEMNVEDFKSLAAKTRDYLKEVPKSTQATNSQLMEIMMAQDFQDLTGQVIKKIVDMAQQMEQQLVSLLLESTPSEKRQELSNSLVNGPVINPEGRNDIVTDQAQVDDLLESLGF